MNCTSYCELKRTVGVREDWCESTYGLLKKKKKYCETSPRLAFLIRCRVSRCMSFPPLSKTFEAVHAFKCVSINSNTTIVIVIVNNTARDYFETTASFVPYSRPGPVPGDFQSSTWPNPDPIVIRNVKRARFSASTAGWCRPSPNSRRPRCTASSPRSGRTSWRCRTCATTTCTWSSWPCTCWSTPCCSPPESTSTGTPTCTRSWPGPAVSRVGGWSPCVTRSRRLENPTGDITASTTGAQTRLQSRSWRAYRFFFRFQTENRNTVGKTDENARLRRAPASIYDWNWALLAQLKSPTLAWECWSINMVPGEQRFFKSNIDLSLNHWSSLNR